MAPLVVTLVAWPVFWRSGGKGGKAVKGDGYGKGKSHKGKGKAKGAYGAGGFHHGNFDNTSVPNHLWFIYSPLRRFWGGGSLVPLDSHDFVMVQWASVCQKKGVSRGNSTWNCVFVGFRIKQRYKCLDFLCVLLKVKFFLTVVICKYQWNVESGACWLHQKESSISTTSQSIYPSELRWPFPVVGKNLVNLDHYPESPPIPPSSPARKILMNFDGIVKTTCWSVPLIYLVKSLCNQSNPWKTTKPQASFLRLSFGLPFITTICFFRKSL